MDAGDKVIVELGSRAIPKGDRGCWRELSGVLVGSDNYYFVVELLEDDLFAWVPPNHLKGTRVRSSNIRINPETDVVEEW